MPPVPEHPTKAEVAKAVEVLDDALADFGLVGTANRANALALMVTPVVRPLVPLAPLFVADAPVMGSGKGLFVDLCSIVATGDKANCNPGQAG